MLEQQGQGMPNIGSVGRVKNHGRDGSVLVQRSAQEIACQEGQLRGDACLGDEPQAPDGPARVSSHGHSK